jgi:hypothetical protein
MLSVKKDNVYRIVSENDYECKWKILGFEIVGDNSGKSEVKPLIDMTVFELRKYAKENRVDLNGATTKVDILNSIKEYGDG